jgi:hypothetical protein
MISKIQMEQFIKEKESQKKIKELEDEAMLHHEQALADAEFYKSKKFAEANSVPCFYVLD